MVEFGDKLRQLRTLKGLSQEQLAKRMGITKSMISAYENSVRQPSYDVLMRIALFFNVSMDFFFGFDKRKYLDVTNLSDTQVSVLSKIIDELRQN